MLPEIWQTVQRLLVLYVSGDRGSEASLEPALQVLHETLPQVDITLLAIQPNSNPLQLIEKIRDRTFDAAIVFTPPAESPYTLAYLCYLAGIPIRLGQSQEFGGGVLSDWIKPPLDPVSSKDYYLHLLRSAGFPVEAQRKQGEQRGQRELGEASNYPLPINPLKAS